MDKGAIKALLIVFVLCPILGVFLFHVAIIGLLALAHAGDVGQTLANWLVMLVVGIVAIIAVKVWEESKKRRENRKRLRRCGDGR